MTERRIDVTGIFLNAQAAMLAGSQTRIFGLDAQLLFDILVQGLAICLLFIFLSYILIEPVKKVINDRQAKITNDLESAARDKEEAAKLKAEYDEKIGNYLEQLSDIDSLVTDFNRDIAGYMDEFVAACFIPHTDRNLFPSSVQEM